MTPKDDSELYAKLEQAFTEKVNRLKGEYVAKVTEVFSKYEKTKQEEIRKRLGI